MPIYEFRCQRCDVVFEEILSIHSGGKRTCPACGKPARRLISRSSFQLKGSGWYVTDYKSPAAGARSSSEPRATSGASEATGSGSS
jgi:putative FmdB family regulatory protein